jgi:hypothetical protein
MTNTAKARHSKAEIRWGTPSDIVERARNVMGSIDLDPCTSVAFNQTVKAQVFYSLDEHGIDGLKQPWFGNVFVNPPGGLVKEFWRKAFVEELNNWDKLFWVGFSVEQLALLASEEHHPMDFSFCILRKRVSFQRHDGFKGSPSHANYVCAVNVDHAKFTEQFSPLGRVYPRK